MKCRVWCHWRLASVSQTSTGKMPVAPVKSTVTDH